MAGNTVTYDTREIRRAARQIRSFADSINETASSKLSAGQGEIEESLRGMTAEALSERLKNIKSDVGTISNGLEALYRALMRYADALDEADRKMAAVFD